MVGILHAKTAQGDMVPVPKPVLGCRHTTWRWQERDPMESSSRRNNTRAMAVFWSLMVVCGLLTAVCVHLAGREVGQPWAGFSFNAFGDVMKANDTGLVFFDSILAVDGQPVQRQKGTGTAIQKIISRTGQERR